MTDLAKLTREREWADDVDRLRAELADQVHDAGAALVAVEYTLEQLRSDSVYDVEYEGIDGADMLRFVQDAARMVRAVDAINPAKPAVLR